jgi:hypothetical protein
MLTSKLIVVLCHPSFGINLPSTGSRLMSLLVIMMLYGEELHSWLGCHGPHCDRWIGLESRSVLQHGRSGDGVSRDHHVAPSGGGGSRAAQAP